MDVEQRVEASASRMSNMERRGWAGCVVVAVLATTASTQEEQPPKRHVNRVTPEAQAAIDRYVGLVHHPFSSGLRSMTSSLVVTGFGTDERAKCDYGADTGLTVTFPPALKKAMEYVGTNCVERALVAFYQERFKLSRDEFDAEFVAKDGRSTLVMTEYADGRPDHTSEFSLDAEGLVAEHAWRPGPASNWKATAEAYTWEMRRGLRHVASTSTTYEDGRGWTSSLEFGEENGQWLPVRISTAYRWADGTKKSFDVYVADLVVNGKTVDLPTPWKHVNNVTPEARAAIDEFVKLVHRPEDYGVKKASGSIVSLGFERPIRAGFEFTKEHGVEPIDSDALREAMRVRDLKRSALKFPLEMAFDASSVLLDDEQDAAIEIVDGRRVLAITGYREGKPMFAERCTLDERGLMVRREWRDLAGRGREDFVETYAWKQFRSGWCLAELYAVHAEPDASRDTFVFRYTDVGDAHLVSSYEARYLTPKTFTLTCHVDDLFVDGKKVELPTPWKHVGVVTPEARAAIDRAKSLVDRPSDHGVTSMHAGLVENGVPTTWRFEFERGVAEIEPANGAKPTDAQRKSALINYWIPFSHACGGGSISMDGETDAEFVERDGVRCVRVTKWRDGVRGAARDHEIDGRGLVARTIVEARGGGEMTFRLGWLSVGERFRVESIDVSISPKDGSAETTQHRVDWREVDGTPVPARIKSTYELTTGERREKTVKLRDLAINGVSVPDPLAHLNVVSPEAKAAIDRYERLVDRPAERELKSLTAAVDIDGDGGPLSGRMEFTPPGGVVVSPEPRTKPTKSQESAGSYYVTVPFTLAFRGVLMPDASEFDAELVRRGGTTTLLVSKYHDGEKIHATEFGFDADGMPVSETRVGSDDFPRITYQWARIGDKRRLSAITIETPAHRTEFVPAYHEVGGVQIPAVIRATTRVAGEGEDRERRTTVRLRSIVLNGKSVDFVDPTAHVNVVTPEANAALEQFAKLVYRPTDHGVKTASATFLPSGLRFELAGGRCSLLPPADESGGTWAAFAATFDPLLRSAWFGPPIADSTHFDAEVVDKLGRRVLVLTSFRDGVAVSRNSLAFDDRGLVVAIHFDVLLPPVKSSEMRVSWTPVGGLWQVERVECWDVKQAQRVTIAFGFADAAGARVPASMKLLVSNVPNVDSAPVLAATDLIVNGAKVVLPPLLVHANEVTPEARTLMDAYERRFRRTVGAGVASASGALTADDAPAATRRFTYSAPLFVSVAAPSEAKPDSPAATELNELIRFGLIAAIDGVRLTESLEYDARVVDRGSGRVLEVVSYATGERTASSEFSFDADGRVASMRRREGVDPAAPESDVTMRCEWAPADEVERLQAVEVTVGKTRKRFEYSYVEVGGVTFLRSFSFLFEADDGSFQANYRVEDLVLNGKKVALPTHDDAK
jgi:hypothetical protein